jgi:ribonuclease VapC
VIVDTSALVAILAHEREREVFVETILHAQSARMSCANYLEAALVIDGYRDPVLSRRLDELIDDLGIEIHDLTRTQARIARDAYRDYGKGSGHAAGLNFGDCFAYALASDTGEPLLFKGEDFGHTDLQPAV